MNGWSRIVRDGHPDAAMPGVATISALREHAIEVARSALIMSTDAVLDELGITKCTERRKVHDRAASEFASKILPSVEREVDSIARHLS